MKQTILIILIILSSSVLKATEQRKDLLIVGSDTFLLKSSPLYGTGLDIQYRDTNCFSTGLYRGYWAHWILENDSLFLIKVYSGSFLCSDSNISKHIVFEDKLFAQWHSAKIEIPIGEELFCYTCIYPLYEKHKIMTFDNGIIISEVIQSNKGKVSHYDHQDKVAKIKEFLIDSLGAVLNPVVDSSAWNQLDCDWDYTLHFDRKGRLSDITLQGISEILPEDEKCLANLKTALKGFNVSHLAIPKVPFEVTLEIWHLDGQFDIDR